jgi:hypothetical protein
MACIARNIVLVKILILLELNFAKFEICYILTIGTENDDSCLTLGTRCIAIGLYVMLEVHENCGVLFLKPDGLENFRHTANNNKTYIFAQQNAVCHASKPVMIQLLVSGIAFF